MAIVNKILIVLFWIFLIGLSCWFYYDNAIAYLFGYRNERFGDTFFNNQVWFVAHIIGGTCALFLGPIQFWKTIRLSYLNYHRLAGKIYIVGCLIAGFSALWLSLIYDCVGCRYSLFPLSVLLIFTTIGAWVSIKNKNIKAHQQFMVRSYICALAFVAVRLNQVLPLEFFLGAIEDKVVKRVVNEWFFSLMPLLIAEIWMIWLPSLKSVKMR